MKYETENISELAAALSKCQGEMQTAIKDSKGVYGKYAKLEDVIAASRPHLAANNLCVVQRVFHEDGKSFLKTRLIHSSGQWIEDCALLMPTKPDSQAQGSAITYMRRYCYASLVGVIQEDDDGMRATLGAACNQESKSNEGDEPITEKAVMAIKSKFDEANIERILTHYKVDRLEDLKRSHVLEINNAFKK